jgi:hypothetical protein
MTRAYPLLHGRCPNYIHYLATCLPCATALVVCSLLLRIFNFFVVCVLYESTPIVKSNVERSDDLGGQILGPNMSDSRKHKLQCSNTRIQHLVKMLIQ